MSKPIQSEQKWNYLYLFIYCHIDQIMSNVNLTHIDNSYIFQWLSIDRDRQDAYAIYLTFMLITFYDI